MLCGQCRCVSLLTVMSVTVMLTEHSEGSNDRVAFYALWFKVSRTNTPEMSSVDSWEWCQVSFFFFFPLRMTLLLVFSDLKPHCTLSLCVISSFTRFQLWKDLFGCHILHFLICLVWYKIHAIALCYLNVYAVSSWAHYCIVLLGN